MTEINLWVYSSYTRLYHMHGTFKVNFCSFSDLKLAFPLITFLLRLWLQMKSYRKIVLDVLCLRYIRLCEFHYILLFKIFLFQLFKFWRKTWCDCEFHLASQINYECSYTFPFSTFVLVPNILPRFKIDHTFWLLHYSHTSFIWQCFVIFV